MKNGGGSTEATGTHIAAVVSHLPTPDSGRAGRAPLNVAGIAQILAARVWARFMQEHGIKKPSDVREHLIEHTAGAALYLLQPEELNYPDIPAAALLEKQKSKAPRTRDNPAGVVWLISGISPTPRQPLLDCTPSTAKGLGFVLMRNRKL
ncbi:hypothetical protein Anapl_15761 [Anas platyrhynchos]|uniref:Uncharacterized protein n=1 Tax=Anas platyrhynchos TaxID=8839 RepID=R0JQH6_ANAPL|nr:hypothetical protein Anapl_15761 [Anas platyrhynchos]